MPRDLQRWSKVGYPNGMERRAIGIRFSLYRSLLLIHYTLSPKHAPYSILTRSIVEVIIIYVRKIAQRMDRGVNVHRYTININQLNH